MNDMEKWILNLYYKYPDRFVTHEENSESTDSCKAYTIIGVTKDLLSISALIYLNVYGIVEKIERVMVIDAKAYFEALDKSA